MGKVWLSSISLVCLLVFLSLPLRAENSGINEDFELFTNEDGIYSVLIPRGVSEKSISSGRVLWNYLAPGSTSPLIIRINHVFIGLTVSHDEYISILEESKKNDGMETQKLTLKEGRAFACESKAKRSDDETQAVYLVALSDRGWLCTLTFSGRGAILKRERPLITKIIESFQFLPDRKK